MKGRKKKPLKVRLTAFAAKTLLLIFCFTLIQAALLRWINPVITPNLAWEWTESIIGKDPGKRPLFIWKDLETISPHLRRAVLAAEDQRFLSHHGFDTTEIRHALERLWETGRLRGASTISMQTARSVFWLSSRSIVRKAVEAYYTILIELFWDKERILEIYLNTVDWGPHVTGAEAAARTYFNKSARSLTASQAALMAAILPSPHRWSARHPGPHVKKRQARILKAMRSMPLL